MAAGYVPLLLRQLRRWSGSRGVEDSDSRLLERFLADRDEAAFTALVRRHGAMVFGVCRRVLHHEQDAEDAFQATFLILARKAASLRVERSLGGWLHEVAFHLALRARETTARRQSNEKEIHAVTPTEDAAMEASRRELRLLLDEELRQLPAKYREPLILCYLEGKTNEQAARQLGWPAGSMSRRLARGRELLRRRLVHRGLTLSVGALTAGLVEQSAAAAVPPGLIASVVRLAVQASASAIPASVAALVEERVRGMVLARLRMPLFLALTAMAVGAGALAYQTRGKQPAEEQPAPAAKTAGKQPHADLYGDPLPPGALARLGTLRLRHISAAVAFSPDGKTLISAGADGTIRYWEPATGKETRRVHVQTADSHAHPQLFTADGKTVAGMASEDICVWDTDTGKELQRFSVGKVPLPGLEGQSAQVFRLALSADGKLLAAHVYDIKEHNVHVWNARTGKKLFTLKMRHYSDAVAFSPDGKLLGTVAYDDLRLWDTATGKEVRKIVGAQNYLAFSADGKRLAAVSRGGGVKVWNVADGKEVFDVKPVPGRFPGSLDFAPDGQTLAVSSPEGWVLYDVIAGKYLRTIGASYYGRLVFSPAGRTAASISGSATRLWDVATGKEIRPRPGHNSAVTSLAIAPDGGRIATFETGPLFRVWDATSGRSLLHMAAPKQHVRSGAFSPDGRFLVTDSAENSLCLRDSKTGAEVRRFTIESADPALKRLGVWSLALSSDGKRLVALVSGGDAIPTYQVHVWDFATGKRLARRMLPHAGFETRFSPDTRSMANPTNDGIVVTDTATGQQPVKVKGRAPLEFSPDGQVLATTVYRQKKPQPGEAMPAGSEGGWGGLPQDAEAVALTELATGEILTFIETGRSGFSLLAFSPDGRMLATADRDSFRLWDVATGKELFRRALHEKNRDSFGYSFATSMAFLPDGGRLATGLIDSTVLIWDLAPKTWHAGIAVQDLAPRDLERLWADLAAENSAAVKAHQAVWTLAAVPAKAIPFLKDRLRPATALDARQVQRLIADLDSPEFAVREAAAKKLTSFGEQAEPALRQALEGKPSLEARKRLEVLHAGAEQAGRGVVRSAELLRTLRAIRVLEHIGDQEARQVLQKLAAGDPAARSTRQAREALQRLERRATER